MKGKLLENLTLAVGVITILAAVFLMYIDTEMVAAPKINLLFSIGFIFYIAYSFILSRNLNEEISGLEKHVSNLKEEVSRLNSTIGEKNNQISAQQNEIGTLKVAVDKAEKQKATVSKELKEAQKRVAELEAQLPEAQQES